MNENDLVIFCNRWLEAWTGNRPKILLSFYAENAFYRDPARTQGLKGHAELEKYFKRLLAVNPEWIWTAEEIIPTARGCTLKWKAKIPSPSGFIETFGLDIVEIHDGKITRNEVYFDTSVLR